MVKIPRKKIQPNLRQIVRSKIDKKVNLRKPIQKSLTEIPIQNNFDNFEFSLSKILTEQSRFNKGWHFLNSVLSTNYDFVLIFTAAIAQYRIQDSISRVGVFRTSFFYFVDYIVRDIYIPK